VYQAVLSQRFETEIAAEPFTIYRALRHVNPSPYMYFIRMGDQAIVGSSPEMLVRVEGRRVETHPIAGTRPRGRTGEEDLRLADELKRNEKERAEHVMLVDLGRNDLGRVCDYGSVRVPEFMALERYSHVMHLVSRVEGRSPRIAIGSTRLIATFPAGTVSGAPKIRAMDLLAGLEPTPRGIYAGAVGYLDFAGNLDFCIAIRTITIAAAAPFVQAGAGIVADSNAAAEFEETRDKARAMLTGARAGPRGAVMLLLLDNYDSFTWNLAAVPGRAGTRGGDRAPQRRDRRGRGLDAPRARPKIVISPGPGRPEDAGVSMAVDPALRSDACRCSASAWGTRRSGRLRRSRSCARPVPCTARPPRSEHDGRACSAGSPAPFEAARYHSLVVAEDGGRPIAGDRRPRPDDRVVMGVRHRSGRCTACSSIPNRS
jgi:anthranilate/para-aminobenzoate synthase component II